MPAVLQHLDDQTRSLRRLLNVRDPDIASLKAATDVMSGSVGAVTQMINFVQPMLRGRRLSKRKGLLSSFVREFFDLRGSRLLTRGIRWHIETEQMRDFEILFNPGRFTQILDNLTTNSEYWLGHRYGRESKKGTITIGVNDPELVFYDNGPGIATHVEESLFELFSSGKPREEGSGLGLFITRQLLLRDNCDIALAGARNEEGRLYRFVINFSGARV